MFYERKIRYLDYYRNGERIKNGGFAKTEVRDDSFKLEIALKGIVCADTDSVDVLLYSGEREIVLGKFALKSGCGDLCYRGSMKNGIDGTGMQYGDVSGIRIPLSEVSEVSCNWYPCAGSGRREKVEVVAAEREIVMEREMPEQTEMKSVKEEKQKIVADGAERISERISEAEKVKSAELPKTPENQGKEFDTEDTCQGQAAEREQQFKIAGQGCRQETKESERRPEAISLLEDKWLQLVSIYPHIKPFRDEREYLSIGPADFVLFTAESYRAANNSFLLHGYYNYRHLILTRVERRGEILYYVGVPGNYYDREKQVAVMFGFESFECAEEPAQNADFGYYMMRVKL